MFKSRTPLGEDFSNATNFFVSKPNDVSNLKQIIRYLETRRSITTQMYYSLPDVAVPFGSLLLHYHHGVMKSNSTSIVCRTLANVLKSISRCLSVCYSTHNILIISDCKYSVHIFSTSLDFDHLFRGVLTKKLLLLCRRALFKDFDLLFNYIKSYSLKWKFTSH